MPNFTHLLLLLRLLSLPISRPRRSPSTLDSWVDTHDESPFRFSGFNSSLASWVDTHDESPFRFSGFSSSLASALPALAQGSADDAIARLGVGPRYLYEILGIGGDVLLVQTSDPIPRCLDSPCFKLYGDGSFSFSFTLGEFSTLRRTRRLSEEFSDALMDSSASSRPSSALSLPARSTEALGDRPVPGVATATTSRRNYDVQVNFTVSSRMFIS